MLEHASRHSLHELVNGTYVVDAINGTALDANKEDDMNLSNALTDVFHC